MLRILANAPTRGIWKKKITGGNFLVHNSFKFYPLHNPLVLLFTHMLPHLHIIILLSLLPILWAILKRKKQTLWLWWKESIYYTHLGPCINKHVAHCATNENLFCFWMDYIMIEALNNLLVFKVTSFFTMSTFKIQWAHNWMLRKLWPLLMQVSS